LIRLQLANAISVVKKARIDKMLRSYIEGQIEIITSRMQTMEDAYTAS